MGVKVLTRMAVIIWMSVYWKTMKNRLGYTLNYPSGVACIRLTIIMLRCDTN